MKHDVVTSGKIETSCYPVDDKMSDKPGSYIFLIITTSNDVLTVIIIYVPMSQTTLRFAFYLRSTFHTITKQ